MTDKVNTEENNINQEEQINTTDNNVEAEQEAQDIEQEASQSSDVDLTHTVQELEEKIEEYKNNVLLGLADTENAKRRARMDVEKADKYGQEKLINELLPIIDNLEQAIENIE